MGRSGVRQLHPNELRSGEVACTPRGGRVQGQFPPANRRALRNRAKSPILSCPRGLRGYPLNHEYGFENGGRRMSRFKKILVPVDFSEHSTAALEAAIELASVFDSKLHLLHCYQIQPGGISPYGIAIPSSYFAEIRDAASRKLAEWQEKHVPAAIPVDASTMSRASVRSDRHDREGNRRRPHRDGNPRALGIQARHARECRRANGPARSVPGDDRARPRIRIGRRRRRLIPTRADN